jgi:hypothetical protein
MGELDPCGVGSVWRSIQINNVSFIQGVYDFMWIILQFIYGVVSSYKYQKDIGPIRSCYGVLGNLILNVNFTLSDLPSTEYEYIPDRSPTEGIFKMRIISYSARISRLQPMGLCETKWCVNKFLCVRRRGWYLRVLSRPTQSIEKQVANFFKAENRQLENVI